MRVGELGIEVLHGEGADEMYRDDNRQLEEDEQQGAWLKSVWEGKKEGTAAETKEQDEAEEDDDGFGDDFDEFNEGGGDDDFGDFDEADEVEAENEQSPQPIQPSIPNILSGLVSIVHTSTRFSILITLPPATFKPLQFDPRPTPRSNIPLH